MMCEDCKNCIDCSESNKVMSVNRDRTIFRQVSSFYGKICNLGKRVRYDFNSGEYKCTSYEK